MGKSWVVLALGIFIGGCDQSVLAPVGSGYSSQNWSEAEREQHFSETYSGSWITDCLKTSLKSAEKAHFFFKEGTGIYKSEIFRDDNCINLETSKPRTFGYKTISAWVYSHYPTNYTIHIVFDKSEEGEISQYNSDLYGADSGYAEQQASLFVVKDGKETFLSSLRPGHFYYRE